MGSLYGGKVSRRISRIYRAYSHNLAAIVLRLKMTNGLLLDYAYDMWRYLLNSGTVDYRRTRDRLKARLTMHYHAIEKGLALREPRPGFGSLTVQALIRNLHIYTRRYGSDETVKVSLNVLRAYIEFNASKGIDMSKLAFEVAQLSKICEDGISGGKGGVYTVTSNEIQSSAKGTFKELVRSRHSIRQFAPMAVDIETVREAIAIATQSPSVCNRPSWRVRAYEGAEKDRVLALQTGNRGFGHEAPVVLIVTGDLSYFAGNRERNQVYIDGGLFAMTLIYPGFLKGRLDVSGEPVGTSFGRLIFQKQGAL